MSFADNEWTITGIACSTFIEPKQMVLDRDDYAARLKESLDYLRSIGGVIGLSGWDGERFTGWEVNCADPKFNYPFLDGNGLIAFAERLQREGA